MSKIMKTKWKKEIMTKRNWNRRKREKEIETNLNRKRKWKTFCPTRIWLGNRKKL
jgi:hypothetical protein